MKSKQLITAIAAGLAFNSGIALALPPGAPDIEIILSGATAQDNNIGALFAELCVAGSLDEYRDGTSGSAGGNHRAYFCNLDTGKVTGLSATSPKVLFHKTSTSKATGTAIGGSGIGVNPVLKKQPVDVMSINNGNCTAPANGEKYWRCRISQTGDVTPQVPDAGVSDVNPELFIGANTPAGVAPVDAGEVAKLLQVVSGGSLVFNTPVTLELRNALQRAQIEEGILAADCLGKETEVCMPGMSKQLIASLLTGQVGKWDSVMVGKPGSLKPLTDFASGAITDSKVHICRRTNGSGTQATINAKILNAPCTAGALDPVETSNDLAGPIVKLNAGSGDVERCLVDFNAGSNTSGQNAGATKAFAIGVQSTEKNPSNALAYRFIKIDGVAPTLQNAAAGRYGVAAEVTYQWLKSGGPTGDKAKIISRVATDAGKPSIIAANNKSFAFTWGQGGYLAVSTAGWEVSPTGELDLNNPVTPYTHAPNGLSLDNCRVPVVDSGKRNRL